MSFVFVVIFSGPSGSHSQFGEAFIARERKCDVQFVLHIFNMEAVKPGFAASANKV